MIPDDELAAMRERCAGHDVTHPTSLKQMILRCLDEIDRLKAELAAHELRWTEAKPTTVGWYWWRTKGFEDRPVRVFVGYDGHLREQHYGAGDLQRISLTGQWSDKPIPLPKERP